MTDSKIFARECDKLGVCNAGVGDVVFFLGGYGTVLETSLLAIGSHWLPRAHVRFFYPVEWTDWIGCCALRDVDFTELLAVASAMENGSPL